IWLPTALSIQVDRSISEMFFLNATLVQGVPLHRTAAPRGSMLALTPRLESRWYGAALPIKLYNWDTPTVGLAMRLGFLVVGSDNLGSLFGRQAEFSGTDLYVALKVNPFGKGRKLASPVKGKRRNSDNGCYDF
ncbi:MAG: hypothetical protein R3350_08860, partial [Saprospiraceae bacterium]|nr:hypothetical protein [Saprospiraceae bacterium]